MPATPGASVMPAEPAAVARLPRPARPGRPACGIAAGQQGEAQWADLTSQEDADSIGTRLQKLVRALEAG